MQEEYAGPSMSSSSAANARGSEPVYICPKNHVALEADGAGRLVTRGGNVYPIVDGIPQFLAYPSLESAETTGELNRLNKIARQQGWQQAIQKVYGADAKRVSYTSDPRRLACLDLLPLRDDSVVLEIGSGLGPFTGSIAKRVKSIYGLEVVPQQATFVAERARQMGCNNVHMAAGGDDCRLPFLSKFFDVVFCMLVFEWCGSRVENEKVVDAQKRLLGEFMRVLKPGGAIFISTKNRFGLNYLLGGFDEHSYGMRFGRALPHWLLRGIMALRGKPFPPGMLYSYGALRRLLGAGGFVDLRSFWASPEMRRPDCYVSTDRESVVAARRRPEFKQGHSRKTRLVMPWVPAGLVKYVTPGLCFLGTKPAESVD